MTTRPVLPTELYQQLHTPGAPLPKPTWAHSDERRFGHLLQAAIREATSLFRRYVYYRGNKVAYLRHLGVHIGEGCDLLNGIKDFGSEPWLIELGNRVTLAHGVVLITHDGASRLFRQTLPGSSPWGNRFGTIQLGDNVFVGVNTIILPDVKIGSNSIIGAGSVVTKDVPPQTVAAGVPARPICSLTEYIERYQQKMIPVTASNGQELRRELTEKLWGAAR